MKHINIVGGVVADTVYCNGELVGKDINVTLPTITHKTSEISAMGSVDMPLIGLIEAMETSVTQKGISKQLAKLSKLGKNELEVRFVQNVIDADGVAKAEGCKAFMRVISKVLPGVDLELGTASDAQVTYSVTRYQLIVGGEEVCLVDQLNTQLRINGVDYTKEIKSLL